MNADRNGKNCCGADSSADQESRVNRREFLHSLGSLGAASLSWPAVFAGPFPTSQDPKDAIPQDKKLLPEWLAALTSRGEPTVYRGWEELKYIGMPIGGLGCGTVYLGGDGKLWCWDIFNQAHEGCIPNRISDDKQVSKFGGVVRERDGANFVQPTAEQASPWTIQQGFGLRVGDRWFSLDRHGFSDIRFQGQHPIALIQYLDPSCPLEIGLEAFTPYVPLDLQRSSYPATVMRFTLTNPSQEMVKFEINGKVENCGLKLHSEQGNLQRQWSLRQGPGFMGGLGTQVATDPVHEKTESRPDKLFADFEGEDWGEWTAQGRAFEGGPFPVHQLHPVQDSEGFTGKKFVNTYNTRVVADGENPDDLTGTLLSPPFVIDRRFVNVAVAGGRQPDGVYLQVLIDGQSVAKVTGDGRNQLRGKSIDLSRFAGRTARIQIVDQAKGGWAQIAVDQIVFSDVPVSDQRDFTELPDYGSTALLLMNEAGTCGRWDDQAKKVQPGEHQTDLTDQQVGAIQWQAELAPGETREAVFVIAWHFANTHFSGKKRAYAAQFQDAFAVAEDVARNLPELTRLTRLWRDSWYRGTLPHWFLERSLLTANCLQTNTCYQFEGGQFWAWEGVGCCPGTCTHVWHYAQAVGRLFPELERDLRERTDYGTGFRPKDGRIDFRGGLAGRDATDGQAGVVLRTYREHLVSKDANFLKRVWPRCKKALEFLIQQDSRDGKPDGIPVGEQHNTLDAEWFGKIPVLASLYLAALRAGEAMATTVGDEAARKRYQAINLQGKENILSLFQDQFGYFVQEEDPLHLQAIGIGKGCYIDQVMGQGWAFQLGLGRLYDGNSIRSALNRLWEHNFCPDVGRLRESIPNPKLRGRPYALTGDAGLIMCTWPHGGKRKDWERHWQYGYFQECMTGFEYQVAGHMIWESAWQADLLIKGLAVMRAIHDRYHASRRNPFNEIECSDHYARAMASYGAYLAICGFEYDGPKGHMAFSPRLRPEKSEAAFTAAEGWGSYRQRHREWGMEAELSVAFGSLRIQSLGVSYPRLPGKVEVDGKPASFQWRENRVRITLDQAVSLAAGESLKLILTAKA